MSKHNETLADIVAQIRAAAYIQNADTPQSVLRLADRIEAAWKRERAEIEANALAVGGSSRGGANKPSGNAAAMREALAAVAELLWEIQGLGKSPISNKAYAVKRKVIAALANPPHEAKWTANGGYEFACCSSCGHLQYAGWDGHAEQAEKIGDFHELYKFCPGCGAQMKGATDE